MDETHRMLRVLTARPLVHQHVRPQEFQMQPGLEQRLHHCRRPGELIGLRYARPPLQQPAPAASRSCSCCS